MEIEELVKILVAVFVLLVLIGAVMFLFREKGLGVLDSIKNFLRFS